MYQMVRTLARSLPLIMGGVVIGLGMMVMAAESAATTRMDWQAISTVGGLQQSPAYKLFSITGQPCPVGEASSSQHKLQSGFVPDFGGGGSCCTRAGDANNDNLVNIGDAVYLVNYIFRGGAPPGCAGEGNPNCDAAINIGDAVYLVNYLFRSGAAPCCN